mmetsp:Transcript_19225/g.31554  ORF Transcript_19225/g.31554 Transcript_19225/m.31554 type:complete len:200 (-) Transcript_19225:1695-2294(-)
MSGRMVRNIFPIVDSAKNMLFPQPAKALQAHKAFGDFGVERNFLRKKEASLFFERLKKELPWDTVRWNGMFKLPQKVVQYEPGQGDRMDVLEELVDKVEEQYNVKVEGIFCNQLRDGDDHIPWHSDQYGAHLFVASFGATRTLEYRDRKTKTKTFSEPIEAGTLYYMSPAHDKAHHHQVPKQIDCGERISLAMFATLRI